MNQMITSVLYSPVCNKLIIIRYLELSDYPKGHINSLVQYPLIDELVVNLFNSLHVHIIHLIPSSNTCLCRQQCDAL